MIELDEWLGELDAFRGMPPHEVRAVASVAELVSVRGGERVPTPDVPDRTIHLVLAGLVEQVREEDHLEHAIAWYPQGSLLTPERIDASDAGRRVATRDTLLARIDLQEAVRRVHEHPDVVLLLSRWAFGDGYPVPVMRRRLATVVALVGLEPDSPVAAFAEQLRRSVGAAEVVDWEVGRRVAGVKDGQPFWSDESFVRRARWMSVMVARLDLLILVDCGEDDDWRSACVRQADRVFLVAGPEGDAPPEALTTRLADHLDRVGLVVHAGHNAIVPTTWGGLPRFPVDAEDGMHAVLESLPRHRRDMRWLRRVAPLRGLTDGELAGLTPHVSWVRLPAGEVLFREGDTADAAYVVIAGRLQVFRAEEGGGDGILRLMGPGEMFGEIGLIRNGVRTAGVRARRDSIVARLPWATLRTLLDHPKVSRPVLDAMVDRLLSKRTPERLGEVRSIALVPRSPVKADRELVDHFVRELAAFGKVHCFTPEDVDRWFGPGASALERGAPGERRMVEGLSALEDEVDVSVYVSDGHWDAWTRRCVRQADVVAILADATGSPEPTPLETRLFHAIDGELAATVLVLRQPHGCVVAEGTAAWLAERPVQRHVHVRRGHPHDVSRLARLVLGRAVGLALGGGATRGVLHLGVLRALKESGVPVDVVCGTSAGSALGATLAVGMEPVEAVERVGGLLEDWSRHLSTMGPPVVSLMSGAHPRRLLRGLLGDVHIEDLLIPFTAVAVDLATASLVRIERGPLWLAVRASSSLPAVWPPVVDEEGRVLVDGGVVDNLPYGSLTPWCDRGAIVASECFPYDAGPSVQGYGEGTLSGWRALGLAAWPFRRQRNLPTLGSVLVRALNQQGAKRSREAEADPRVLLVRPDGGPYGLFDIWSRELTRKLADHAFQDVQDRIAAWPWRQMVGILKGSDSR